ncbi:hypothetical protein [Wolbachia endosymbiont of Psylliodes chrysocephala]|uniref:hypothetical protein n=1 Tax=Wolbachia endosymbiont of Psylliodes chrysocephala TaxID=2883236 RepID=UPI00209D8A57|nr:hypothetical protein [Wolbachia endosymbiont of Psylliodes chrysocephala]
MLSNTSSYTPSNNFERSLLPHIALLPTSKEEIYCEDEDGQGENKILSIMQEYQKIGDQRLKDSLCTFVSEIVKISEENLR